MTDSEKIDLILSEIVGMKSEMQSMKTEMQDIKSETQSMKAEMQDIKSEMQNMKAEMQDMNQRLTKLELHLENYTDKNLELIAENFIELSNKLNRAIPAADKNLAYEVKVNYLIEKVSDIEKRMETLEKIS